MKTLIFLLSFMFVSCVTANTESRDLSGVNEKPEQNQTTIEDINRPLMLADYATCMYGCQRDGGSEEECHDVCRTDWRCIRDRTCPFAQSPTENKKPLMLAHYGICMDVCQRDGGSEEDCHYVCSGRWQCEKRGTCRE